MRDLPDDPRLCRRSPRDDPAPPAPGQSGRSGRPCLDGRRRGGRSRAPRLKARSRRDDDHRTRRRHHLRSRLSRHRRAVARLLVLLRRAARHRTRGRGAMTPDRFALCELYAQYGALLDAAQYEQWLALFAAVCSYHIMPRENYESGLPAALVFCDSRAMLEDRIRALCEANKFNIHSDRHLIGLPRLVAREAAAVLVEAPFALYQTDQEGETRLFATGLYRDRIAAADGELKFRDKLVLLDSFAVPSLLATPL